MKNELFTAWRKKLFCSGNFQKARRGKLRDICLKSNQKKEIKKAFQYDL